MAQDDKTTPRPWRYQGWDDYDGDKGAYILGGGPPNSTDEHMVGAALPQPSLRNREECEANAQLIVTAVNERDQLLSSLVEKQEEIERLRAALIEIRDTDPCCACEHDTEDCCVRVEVDCPRCIAALALNPISEPTGE